MTPAAAIAMLDRELEEHGEDVELQKIVAGTVSATVTPRAFVRGYSPDELHGSITQLDRKVIISPSEIDAASWPGGAASIEDKRVPAKGDSVKIAGRVHNVEAATGIRLAGTLVRIEMQVRG